MLFTKVWQNYSFFLICANFATFFLCFLRCFIHFNADLNDFCKEYTKKAAPSEGLLGAEIRLGLINKDDTRLGIGIMDE